MGEVVNLRRARKARDRAAGQAQAAANRTAFGRTGAERARDVAAQDRAEHLLDAAKLDR